MNAAELNQWLIDPARRVQVMGVLNVTPDSFSDGGKFSAPSDAIAQARQMISEGADWIDIGGESTRPGSDAVAASVQIDRTIPIIKALANENIVISIDTTDSTVASAALDAGATMVNDISAGRFDAKMLPLVAERGVPIVLMHMLGSPRTMQVNPKYDDVVLDVIKFFHERVDAAVKSGIVREKILIDPGLGFGKTIQHNLELMRKTRQIVDALRLPMVVGPSRKSFIGTITDEPEPARRLLGTAASIAWCISNGASVVRVHDVRPMKQTVKMIEAIARGFKT